MENDGWMMDDDDGCIMIDDGDDYDDACGQIIKKTDGGLLWHVDGLWWMYWRWWMVYEWWFMIMDEDVSMMDEKKTYYDVLMLDDDGWWMMYDWWLMMKDKWLMMHEDGWRAMMTDDNVWWMDGDGWITMEECWMINEKGVMYTDDGWTVVDGWCMMRDEGWCVQTDVVYWMMTYGCWVMDGVVRMIGDGWIMMDKTYIALWLWMTDNGYDDGWLCVVRVMDDDGLLEYDDGRRMNMDDGSWWCRWWKWTVDDRWCMMDDDGWWMRDGGWRIMDDWWWCGMVVHDGCWGWTEWAMTTIVDDDNDGKWW